MTQELLNKKGICERFSVPIDTLNKDLHKMRLDPTFSVYILKPSYKRVLIDPDGYLEFLRAKSEARLKAL